MTHAHDMRLVRATLEWRSATNRRVCESRELENAVLAKRSIDLHWFCGRDCATVDTRVDLDHHATFIVNRLRTARAVKLLVP